MRAVREHLGLTTLELGKALGYTGKARSLDMHIRRFELGHRRIPPQTWRLLLMYDAYGIPPQWRVARTANKEDNK